MAARGASLDRAPGLARYRLARLAWLDRATGRCIRRYEHSAPGDLIHVDVKKLGKIPDGGGHRVVGRSQAAYENKKRTTTARYPHGRPRIGYSFLHTALDDHSRLAYTEILTDERQKTAAAFWARAHAYFATCGITVRRVETDNGSCYQSRPFSAALGTTITHKRTRPYRPQTNAKVERYHRTLTEEWECVKDLGQFLGVGQAAVAADRCWLSTSVGVR